VQHLICGSGARSYEAQRLLRFQGTTRTRNVQGGIGLLKAIKEDFSVKTATEIPPGPPFSKGGNPFSR